MRPEQKGKRQPRSIAVHIYKAVEEQVCPEVGKKQISPAWHERENVSIRHVLQRRMGERSHPAHGASGGERPRNKNAKLTRIASIYCRQRQKGVVKQRIMQPSIATKQQARDAGDISAEKRSDVTRTISRADTISRMEGGGVSQSKTQKY